MKKLIALVLFYVAASAANAGMLFVKLVDAREQPVMNAEFYWKRPNEEEFRPFRAESTVQKGNGQMQRHREGFVYNYVIGKSVFVGGDRVDIKVVAAGYEVKILQEWIPDRSDRGESQIVVVLDIIERHRR